MNTCIYSNRMFDLMQQEKESLDIPSMSRCIEKIHDARGKRYACKPTIDLFYLTMDDFCPDVEGVLTVGGFMFT